MLLELLQQRNHVFVFGRGLEDQRFRDVGIEQVFRDGQARGRFDRIRQAGNVDLPAPGYSFAALPRAERIARYRCWVRRRDGSAQSIPGVPTPPMSNSEAAVDRAETGTPLFAETLRGR